MSTIADGIRSRPRLALVAEDVERVNSDLIVRDKEGKPYSVRYDQVNVMLLNEFLKEHRKVEKQEAAITQLKKDFERITAQQREEIRVLRAQLDEHAAQIQKVTTRIEISDEAPRLATE